MIYPYELNPQDPRLPRAYYSPKPVGLFLQEALEKEKANTRTTVREFTMMR
jgi:hypothetical protein